MDKKPLIVVSICVVVLLVLGSLSNVVGYQQVQSSDQNTINNEVNQRELLFQTIVDIANNKEIQLIILKSQLSRGEFPVSNIPVLTKNQLKHMYLVGLILSKVISKLRMQSIVKQHQLINPEIQKEISIAIEKNPIIKEEITQLQNSECDCENEDTIGSWKFPVICSTLFILYIFLFVFSLFLVVIFGWDITDFTQLVFGSIVGIIDIFGFFLDCPWYPILKFREVTQ